MTILKCPHCGWKYDPGKIAKASFIISSKVPIHGSEVGSLTDYCPGVAQTPRNAEADNRKLWKEE